MTSQIPIQQLIEIMSLSCEPTLDDLEENLSDMGLNITNIEDVVDNISTGNYVLALNAYFDALPESILPMEEKDTVKEAALEMLKGISYIELKPQVKIVKKPLTPSEIMNSKKPIPLPPPAQVIKEEDNPALAEVYRILIDLGRSDLVTQIANLVFNPKVKKRGATQYSKAKNGNSAHDKLREAWSMVKSGIAVDITEALRRVNNK